MSDISQPLEVLVFEDNPGDYIIVEDFLIEKFKTPKITYCKRFSQCEKLLEERNKFSIILLDLVLPDLKEEELVAMVQNSFKNTPIVILTGYTNINLARSFISKGVSDYLLKDDLNPEILYRTILYAIERENFIIGIENSKNTYKNLFNFTPQPMWLFDNDSLLFLDVNESTIKKYGYSKDEFLKMTIKDISPKSQSFFLDKSLEERKFNKKTRYEGIFSQTTKIGKIIQVEIYSRLFRYNALDATLVLANDITEKLYHLNVIENQNNKLRNIAWTQSHVTRAPLARFMGLISLLEIESEATEETKFLIEQLKNSAHELDMIIHKLVEESKSLF